MFNLDEIYTVSDFLNLCNKTIEDNIPVCWLRGEVSNLSKPASGHFYFSLKDKDTQIRCALFRLNRRNVNFILENGAEVLLRASPTLYPARGDFQIVVQHIEQLGDGNLNLAFEKLKNKLKTEGLFDPIHKKPIPDKIKTIGVVSSVSGAVIRDIIKVVNKRYPFVEILLFDSIVQGKNCVNNLIKAINAADNYNNCDVIIIARGGGSLEDLSSFNDESLARTIFNAKTFIISAIGHETDTTIADFVSDMRAATPSAAAMLVTPDRLELLANTDKLYKQLCSNIKQTLIHKSYLLEQLKLKISTPEKQINLFNQRLDYVSANIKYKMQAIINENNAKLIKLSSSLKQQSYVENIKHNKKMNKFYFKQMHYRIKQIINKNQVQLNNTDDKLTKALRVLLDKNKNKLSSCINLLDNLSPLNILARGYSITLDSTNTVLINTKNIKINQTISTTLIDGKIYSEIKKIEKT
jgi:exodeoxyribonuclease VII large subunit